MEIESAYMAGVADSDGCFSITKRKCNSTIGGYHYGAAFQLTWKQNKMSLRILKEMQFKYGGSIHTDKRQRGNYKESSVFVKYAVYSSKLVSLIEDLLPYLKLKKDQAKLILLLEASRKDWKKNHKGKGRAKPLKVWKLEDKLYEKSAMLKGHKRRDFSIETRTK